MKKVFALIVAATVLITTNVLASNYFGNMSSKKFHYADCSAAKKIKPANRISFNSRDEAVSNDYVPCKICKP